MKREFEHYINNLEKKIEDLIEIINDDELDEETEEEIEEYLHVLFENKKHAKMCLIDMEAEASVHMHKIM